MPFEPYFLEDCQRFVYAGVCNSPVKPVNRKILLTKEELENLEKTCPSIIVEITKNDDDIFVKLDYDVYEKLSPEDQKKLQGHVKKPYWFNMHIYYDLYTDMEYGVMAYKVKPRKDPLVRFSSESTMNRFPMKELIYKNRYKQSLEKIYEHGHGYIIFYFKDGQGSGLAGYLLNQTTDKQKVGLEEDRRDHKAFAALLKHHLKDFENSNISLMEPKNSNDEKIVEAIEATGIKIKEKIELI